METKVTVWNESAKEMLMNALKNVDSYALVNMWNDVCDGDDYIYSNDEDTWKELFSDVAEMFRATFYGGARYNDDYCHFNGYANLETASGSAVEDWIDLDTIAQHIEDNCDDWADLDRYFSNYGVHDIDTEEILPDEDEDDDEEDED